MFDDFEKWALIKIIYYLESTQQRATKHYYSYIRNDTI